MSMAGVIILLHEGGGLDDRLSSCPSLVIEFECFATANLPHVLASFVEVGEEIKDQMMHRINNGSWPTASMSLQ